MSKMKQIHINNQNTHEIVWVEDEPKLKVGCYLSFKESKDLWKVLEIWETEMDKQALYKTWHVGGLY